MEVHVVTKNALRLPNWRWVPIFKFQKQLDLDSTYLFNYSFIYLWNLFSYIFWSWDVLGTHTQTPKKTTSILRWCCSVSWMILKKMTIEKWMFHHGNWLHHDCLGYHRFTMTISPMQPCHVFHEKRGGLKPMWKFLGRAVKRLTGVTRCMFEMINITFIAFLRSTPLKTNISPEKRWLEDVFPIEIVPF